MCFCVFGERIYIAIGKYNSKQSIKTFTTPKHTFPQNRGNSISFEDAPFKGSSTKTHVLNENYRLKNSSER